MKTQIYFSLVALATALPIPAQAVLTLGDPGSDYGSVLAAVGDIDLDGHEDFAIAQPSSTAQSGQVWIVSGKTLGELDTAWGSSTSRYGTAIAGFDSNADGQGELLVGAPGFDGSILDQGEIEHYYRAPGNVFYWNWTVVQGGQLGLSGIGQLIATSNYIDLDGRGDMVFTSNTALVAGTIDGAMAGRDPVSFRELWRIQPISPVEALAVMGDYNGDGRDDVLIGMPTHNGSRGRVEVLSGRDGASLFSTDGTQPNGRLGAQVCPMGDQNGDGLADWAATIPGYGASAGATLSSYGGITQGLSSRRGYGTAASSVGDVDGDGLPDLAVADAEGRVFAAGGTTVGSLAEGFGAAILNLDASGDGLADLIVGAPAAGKVYVYRQPVSASPAGSYEYGRACAGSSGAALRASLFREARLGATPVLRADEAPPGAVVYALLGVPGTVALDAFGAPGCSLHVQPIVTLGGPAGSNGRADLPLAIPDDSALIGAEVRFQWLASDPLANNLGLSMSNGVVFRIGAMR